MVEASSYLYTTRLCECACVQTEKRISENMASVRLRRLLRSRIDDNDSIKRRLHVSRESPVNLSYQESKTSARPA